MNASTMMPVMPRPSATNGVYRDAPAPADPAALIAADLKAVERILADSLKNKHPRVAAVVDHVRHYRGKRLRPVLLLLTAKACGHVAPAHHTLGAVVEMIHTATLVHDDILDAAEVRRKVPTVNTLWGVKPAVLLGDYLFTHAFHLASTVDVTACALIGKATDRVCEGELCQTLNAGNLDLTEAEYFDIIDGKTAALTAVCGRLGAHYAGSPPEVVEAMTRFGTLVGQAFQIADDLLDLVGDEATVGKSLGTDLEQGKLTLPMIHLLTQSPKEVSARARDILSGPPEGREALVPLLHKAGSLDHARRVALALTAEARQCLEAVPMSAYRAVLEAMTDRIVNRES